MNTGEKMARYSLNLPGQLKQEAAHFARQQGISLNQFILRAVAEKVNMLKQDLDDPQFGFIAYRQGAGGRPTAVVRGAGVRAQTLVVAARDWGLSPEQVADEYGIQKEQVYEALAFYEAHREEIDAGLRYEQSLEAANGQT